MFKKLMKSGAHILCLLCIMVWCPTCTQDSALDNDPCFNIFTTTTTEDFVLSDVCELILGTCYLENDPVDVTIFNEVKHFNQGFSEALDVEFTNLDIYYVRTDDGSIVPPPISREISWWIFIQGSSIFEFNIVTHDQKTLPPISNLRDLGYDPETGNYLIEADGHVILTGYNRSGCKVRIELNMPITFGDF